MTHASAAARRLVVTPDAALEGRLRRRYLGARGVAYAGYDFRVYSSMRIGEALKFYAALNPGWDRARLDADLATAGLEEDYEIGRMKRAYQRALVLAIACAQAHQMAVVERADEFDEPGALALLREVVRRTPRVLLACVNAEPGVLDLDVVAVEDPFAE